MEEQLKICVQEHIVARHMYKSLNDRRQFGANEGNYDKMEKLWLKVFLTIYGMLLT